MRFLTMWAAAVAFAALAASPALAADSNAAAGGAVVIYTKDNAPATHKLADLPLKDSVSEFGITWTFEKPVPVGQFVNGDWYVVGPATVVKIDPAPRYGSEVEANELDAREKVSEENRCRNGSMLNTPAKSEVAWDSGVANYYYAQHRAKLPIAMKPGDSLASSISLKKGEKVVYGYHGGTVRGEGDNSPVKVVAVLTCVAEPLPADAFRPGYAGHDPKIYLARDLKRELLPKFAQPAGVENAARFAELIARPWTDTCFFSFDVPQFSMPNYAQGNAMILGDAALMACCEGFKAEDRERLLDRIVQIGIDYYSLVSKGHPGWNAHGGHGSGRKFPIVLAGVLLGDEAMASVNKTCPKAHFGEDEQTAYGDCWTGAKVVFTGHSAIDSVTGVGRDYVRGANAAWGPYEHLTPDKWVPEEFRSDAYRRANTSSGWVAQALLLRAMKLEKVWNHDAFFDYVDRWMYEDDKPIRTEVAKYCKRPYNPDDYLNDDKDWFHQGYTGDREKWVKILWDKYPRGPGHARHRRLEAEARRQLLSCRHREADQEVDQEAAPAT